MNRRDFVIAGLSGLTTAVSRTERGVPAGQSNGGDGGIQPSDLRCEYLTEPLGIDVPHPRLSWVLQSSERGQYQTAYQILVASDPNPLDSDRGDLWDSGKRDSDQCTQLEYAGKALDSRRRCYWKVRVWDRNHKPSEWRDGGLRPPPQV
jgi:hypothetical protein